MITGDPSGIAITHHNFSSALLVLKIQEPTMEQPPPYEQADKVRIAFAKHSTPTNTAPAPKFHLRLPSKADSLGIFRVNEDVQT
jgi:hypothetical protein